MITKKKTKQSYKLNDFEIYKLVKFVESVHNNNSLSPEGKEIDLTYCSLINANYRVHSGQATTTTTDTNRRRENVYLRKTLSDGKAQIDVDAKTDR